MATLRVESLPREFHFNGTRTLTGPEDTGNALRYSFSRAIGSKG